MASNDYEAACNLATELQTLFHNEEIEPEYIVEPKKEETPVVTLKKETLVVDPTKETFQQEWQEMTLHPIFDIKSLLFDEVVTILEFLKDMRTLTHFYFQTSGKTNVYGIAILTEDGDKETNKVLNPTVMCLTRFNNTFEYIIFPLVDLFRSNSTLSINLINEVFAEVKKELSDFLKNETISCILCHQYEGTLHNAKLTTHFQKCKFCDAWAHQRCRLGAKCPSCHK